MKSKTQIAIDELVGTVGSDKMMSGAYEGAGKFDRALSLWNPPRLSADGGILPGKDLADSRVRDITCNDGYIQSGTNLHKDNIVGSMFFFNAKPMRKVLLLDEKWESEFQEEVESKFMLYAESLDNWVDATRNNTLTAQVRLAIGVYSSAGEVFSTCEWLQDTRRPYKSALQMVDLDRLRTPYEYADDDRVRGGIRRDRNGAPIGAYVLMEHPSDGSFIRGNPGAYKYVKIRKPWGRLQYIHIKEQQRPDQTRGVADIVAGLKEVKITKQFRDVTLQNAVVNAMYAASIESELPSEQVFQSMGGGNSGPGAAVVDYAAEYLGAVSEYDGNAKNMRIDGVVIPHLYPGTKLNMQPAGKIGGVGQDFEKSLLRHTAAILGVSYEQLSKDYSESNYASARAAMVETWKFMMSRKRMVADRYAGSFQRLWFEEAVNAGHLETMKYSKAPNMYEGMNLDAYTNGDWIGASRGQIDELKETQAAVLRIKYGLSTHEDELSRMGKDWRKVNVQLAREAKDREDKDIVLFEDNSLNAASGTPREKDITNGPKKKGKKNVEED